MGNHTFNRFFRTALVAPIASCAFLTSVGVGTAGAAPANLPMPLQFIAGADRYETAGLAATRAYQTAETVVLASGTSYPDALAASALAGDRGAPILLMDRDTVPAGTATAYAQLKPSKVVVVGGTDRISDAAIARLTGGAATVTRVAGSDRWATAAAVASKLSAIGTVEGKRTAFLTTGNGFADAVAAGPAAAARKLPILLTEQAGLSAAARSALTGRKVQHVVVLGDLNAVSAKVAADVAALGISVERIAGPDRNATAVAVAGWAAAKGVLGGDGVVVARGDRAGGGADALAIAPLAALQGIPVLLTAGTDDPSTATANWMTAHRDTVSSLTVAGSDRSVSQAAVNVLEQRVDDAWEPCPAGCTVVEWPTYDGQGHLVQSPVSRDVTNVVQAVTGPGDVLVRRTDGTVWGWGNLLEEASGAVWARTPVQVAGLNRTRDLATSARVGLALDADGVVRQFGWATTVPANDQQPLTTTTPKEVALPLPAVDVSAELDHGVAALTDGSVWTWGADLVPTRVAGLTDAVALSSGTRQTTVLRSNGSVWAFGWDFTTVRVAPLPGGAQIDPEYAPTPDRPAHDLGWRGVLQIGSGDHATYALHADGTLTGWGLNTMGELGNGTVASSDGDASRTPVVAQATATGVSSFSAGSSHVVADSGPSWVAWGSNGSGEVDPSSTATAVPRAVPVTAVPRSAVVVAGDGFDVALLPAD